MRVQTVIPRVLGLAAGAVVFAGLSGCADNPVPKGANLIVGKQQFVKNCSACHTLSRANAKGTIGPNLDVTFREGLSEGFGRNTVEGLVHSQILHPARLPKTSAVFMPAALVTGQVAEDVAAYVAFVTGKPGQDTGLLATAVKAAGSGGPIAAKAGKLAMPADPGGQLAYASQKATAPAGKLEIDSKNASATPHDIALTGNGVNAAGKIVSGGAVSSFVVTLKPGTYTYYCTVPGHRAGGMEGTLTVK